MSGTRVFVTGTDTGVGKTELVCALLARLRQRGIDAVPMKPVETGVDGSFASDLERALGAAGLAPSGAELELMSPYRFPLAASPHLAAEEAGVQIDPNAILRAAKALCEAHAVTLIEGAGGIRVPLTRDYTTLELCAALKAPALVVARPGLGTLNHTRLTLDALERAGIPLLGIVISHTEAGAADRILDDNLRTLGELAAPAPLVRLPFLGEPAELSRAGDALDPICDCILKLSEPHS